MYYCTYGIWYLVLIDLILALIAFLSTITEYDLKTLLAYNVFFASNFCRQKAFVFLNFS
jgi:hypothetical protein